MRRLERAEGRRLLAVARGAIEGALCPDLGRDGEPPSLPTALRRRRAAFVTLREDGRLRGCMGRLAFDVPLWVNVRAAALDAAFGDPRFAPLCLAELPFVVSVLERPVALADAAAFQAGRHGIIVERGARMALLLPQVATEMGWNGRAMLDAACHKAGFGAGAWRDRSTRLSVFEAARVSERDTLCRVEAERAMRLG